MPILITSALLLTLPLLSWLDDEPRQAAPAWALEASDIPVNARMTFGVLDNGLRYAWMANPEPDLRCYLRLQVDVGSTAEEDTEQGMAHFLEHMAFNGTQNFEAGELIQWFQAHGMDFGAHLNASTGFEKTVYKIDLPDTTEQTLAEGLIVLRDFATGMLLEEEEVAKEIGVIDGEERERDSAQLRVWMDGIRLRFAGTRIAERFPIGVREVRGSFTPESVRAFYERWYRPENMTLVLVGDLGELDPTDVITQHLGSIEVPPDEHQAPPGLGEPSFEHLSYALYNDEVKTVELSLARLQKYEQEPLTIAEWVEDVPLRLARSMLNLRYRELANTAGTPFIGAGTGSAEAFDVLDGEALFITCDPDKWHEALALAERELRTALLYGFQQPELDEVVADRLLALDESVEREPTRSSASYLGSILAAADGDIVPTTAETNRNILKPAYEGATLKTCHAALVEAWEEGVLSLAATGGLDLGEDGAEQLMAAYEEVTATEVEKPAEIVAGAFAYASSDEHAGEIAKRTHVEDLDITQVRFANGVLLNVKPTDFKENEIQISARVGEGVLALPPEDIAIATVCQFLGLNTVGTGAHDIDELRRLTAGRQASIPVIGTGDDHFDIRASTNPDDLLLQLELMSAYLADPGWRDDRLQQMQQMAPLIYQQLEHQPQGPLVRHFLPAFHGGDRRFGLAPQEDIVEVQMASIQEWVAPHLANGPVEMSIVGDLDVETVIAAVARTLGTLPDRRAARPYDERREVELVPGIHQEHDIVTQVEGENVLIFYPTTDGRIAALRRKLSMLAKVLGDRLREQIREDLGEAYSPSAFSSAGRVYPGVGFLGIRTSADTGRAADVLEACLRIGDELAEDGVTEEELDRLREPELKGIRDQFRQNGYWMNVLSRSQSDPSTLDDQRQLLPDYESMGAEDLSDLAQRYLGRDNASHLVVRQAVSQGP